MQGTIGDIDLIPDAHVHTCRTVPFLTCSLSKKDINVSSMCTSTFTLHMHNVHVYVLFIHTLGTKSLLLGTVLY